MPRRIISQDPITRPAVEKKTYNDMKMVHFKTSFQGDKTRLRATLQGYDYATGELDDEGLARVVTIKDLESQMLISPKFEAAWNVINDVMGLAYDFYRLRDKVREAEAAGEDATDLIAARDAALTALRAPVA